MFIGVETDERGKALEEVAFRAIGDLAVDVLRKAETAAHADKLRNKFGPVTSGANATGMQDGMSGKGMCGSPSEGGADELPCRVEGRPGKLNGKGRGTVKATASWGRAVKMPAHGGITLASTTAHLRLVIDNGMRGASRRQNRAYPSPASRSPLVIVGGTHYTASGSF